MNKGFFNRRIPTIIALLILVVIIGVSTYLIQSGIFYIGKASVSTQPVNFIITNLSENSFTVAFSTADPTEAFLVLESANNKTITDDRQKIENKNQNYFNHHITVDSLTPGSAYQFYLVIDGKEYKGTNFTAKTLPLQSPTIQNQNILTGQVKLLDGNPATDTLVIANTTESLKISTVTDSSGNFTLSTNNLRGKDRTNQILQPDTQVFLTFSKNSLVSNVNTTFENAKKLPTVILQENYTFLTTSENVAQEESNLNFITESNDSQTVSISIPSDNQGFVDLRPLFKGTSYPNSKVDITISGNITKQIVTSSNGSWTYQPLNNFIPGNYILTISSGEGLNKVTISRKFTIYPLGSQVTDITGQSIAQAVRLTGAPSPTSIPSPTKTPTPMPSVTKTPTPLPSATSTPTAPPTSTPTPIAQVTPSTPITPSSLPTATNTPSPTPTALPTINYTPTPMRPLPSPGAFENTAIMTGISIALIAGGIIMLLLL